MKFRANWLFIGIFAIAVMSVSLVACNKNDDDRFTSPTSVVDVEAPPQASAPAPDPTPAASPTPAPTPAPQMSFIRNKNKQDGSGEFCGRPVGGSSVFLSYNPVGATSPTWAKLEVKDPNVNDDICVPIPPAVQVLQAQYGCGFNKKVQIDGNQSGYNAGRFVGSITTDVAIKTADCGCEDYEKPAVNVTLGTPVTSQTVTTFTVSSIPVTKNPAGVTGSFTPAMPKTVDRPNYDQPAGTLSFTYNWTYNYHPSDALSCSVSGNVSKNVSVPPRDDTCEDYERPGEPNWSGSLALTNQTPMTVTVVQGSISPVGTLNPTLPQTVNRPEYGQTAQFQTTNTVTLPYGPQDLQCRVSYSQVFSIKLPAKPCPKENIWTLKNERNDGPWTIVVTTSKNHPEDNIIPNGVFTLGAHQSAQFTGYDNTTLHAFFRFAHQTTLYVYYMHDSSIHARNACENDGGTWLDGSNHVCNTPHDHGYKWSNYYQHDDAYKHGTTPGPTTYTYDFADSETSGSCGVGGPSAQWKGDASLKVKCVCPLD